MNAKNQRISANTDMKPDHDHTSVNEMAADELILCYERMFGQPHKGFKNQEIKPIPPAFEFEKVALWKEGAISYATSTASE